MKYIKRNSHDGMIAISDVGRDATKGTCFFISRAKSAGCLFCAGKVKKCIE